MNSATVPSFWEAYKQLDQDTKERAKKAFLLWAENPFYPSLRFKCVNSRASIWSVRITRGIRAVGKLKDNTVTWFWIGNHDDHEKFFG
jgi:hypothetical protein